MGEEYTLTCNKDQLRLIADALEMQSRMICGQIEETFLPPLRDRVFKMISNKDENYHNKRDEVDKSLNKIKSILWPELNGHAHYGVGHDGKADLGYEMYKEILHQFEKERQKGCEESGEEYYWNVHSSSNVLKLTDNPTIKIELK